MMEILCFRYKTTPVNCDYREMLRCEKFSKENHILQEGNRKCVVIMSKGLRHVSHTAAFPNKKSNVSFFRNPVTSNNRSQIEMLKSLRVNIKNLGFNH